MQNEVILIRSEQVEVEKGLYTVRLHLSCNHKHNYLINMDKKNEKEIYDFFLKGKHTDLLICPMCRITIVNKN